MGYQEIDGLLAKKTSDLGEVHGQVNKPDSAKSSKLIISDNIANSVLSGHRLS